MYIYMYIHTYICTHTRSVLELKIQEVQFWWLKKVAYGLISMGYGLSFNGGPAVGQTVYICFGLACILL